MTTKEQRDATKARHEAYRAVARAIGGVRVRDHVQVCECEGGAFIEVLMWIPKSSISADAESAHHARLGPSLEETESR